MVNVFWIDLIFKSTSLNLASYGLEELGPYTLASVVHLADLNSLEMS